MSAPPAKRARQNGSFSPGSPPYYEGAKTERNNTDPLPQTPFSPPSMSSTAPVYVSDAAANTSVTETPQPASMPSSSFPAIPGLTLTKDGDGDTLMKDETPAGVKAVPIPEQTASTAIGGAAAADNAHKERSDHERDDEVAKTKAAWDRFKSPDMGGYYFMDKKPVERPKLHASDDWIKTFGLTDIANSVRRTDPITGEKINKIRKSYEGIVKTLGVAGRNKAVFTEGEFYPNITNIPEAEWQAQHVHGHEIPEILSDEFLKKLDLALSGMGPGPVTGEIGEKCKALIGTEDGTKKAPVELSRKVSGAPLTAVSARPSAVSSPALQPTRPRPERAGTKRRYDDSSFAGYDETFANADLEDSDDDGRGGSRVKKKVRKVHERSKSSNLAGELQQLVEPHGHKLVKSCDAAINV